MDFNDDTLRAFSMLGKEMTDYANGQLSSAVSSEYDEIVRKAGVANPWFVHEHVLKAIEHIGDALEIEKLMQWTNRYKKRSLKVTPSLTIGVVMAGNVPLVGFHDFICVLVSGNRFYGKTSKDDQVLLPFLASRLIGFAPWLADRITFIENRIEGFDAVIATGSNNTSRYFEYYFGKFPHIIRKNRNGVAVLTGDEDVEDLRLLADDIFLYFGMGCRNVSKIFVPEGYNFSLLMEAMGSWAHVANMNKYANNYDYYRSVYLINGVPHLDNGFVMITEDSRISSPPSVLYSERYANLGELQARLRLLAGDIQCVVARKDVLEGAVSFGEAQKPELWDYADGVDTMDFLMKLRH